jgi:hypothetical protein
MEAYLPKTQRPHGVWEGYSGSQFGHEIVQARGDSGVLEAVTVGEVQDNGDGTYSCSYTHTVAGSFYLHVTNGERPKKSAPGMLTCVEWRLSLHQDTQITPAFSAQHTSAEVKLMCCMTVC